MFVVGVGTDSTNGEPLTAIVDSFGLETASESISTQHCDSFFEHFQLLLLCLGCSYTLLV